jgi:hypothetical protein
MGQYIRYIPSDDLENIRLSYSCTFLLSSYGRITFVVSSPARRFECEKEGISAGKKKLYTCVQLLQIQIQNGFHILNPRGAIFLESNLDAKSQLYHQRGLLETTVTILEERRKLYFKKH